MKKLFTPKTKLNKDDTNAVVTALTLNFTGVTVEELIAPASESLIITKQAEWRRKKVIPQAEEVMVKDMIARMGSRGQAPLTVEGIAAVAGTMTAEQRDALIERLRADAKAYEDAQKAKADAEKKAAKVTSKKGGKSSQTEAVQ